MINSLRKTVILEYSVCHDYTYWTGGLQKKRFRMRRGRMGDNPVQMDARRSSLCDKSPF